MFFYINTHNYTLLKFKMYLLRFYSAFNNIFWVNIFVMVNERAKLY